jgi:hypothetical protein
MPDEPHEPKKKDRKRQRNKVFTVRLNDAEWLAMRERADRAGLTVGGYFRKAALEVEPLRASRRPPVDRAELALVLGQVGKIGGNINQLTKLAHLGGWPEHEDLRQAVADLRFMRDTLLKALGFMPPGGTGLARDHQSVTT